MLSRIFNIVKINIALTAPIISNLASLIQELIIRLLNLRIAKFFIQFVEAF